MTMPNSTGKKRAMRSQPYTKNYRQLNKARIGKGCPPQGRGHHLLDQCQWSALKTLIKVTLNILTSLHLEICMHT